MTKNLQAPHHTRSPRHGGARVLVRLQEEAPTTTQDARPPVTAKPPADTQVAPPPASTTSRDVTADVLKQDVAEINKKGYLTDAFFDYDQSDLREDARTALAADAEWLKKYPTVQILIEGYCDERGHRRLQPGPGRSPRQRRQGVPGLARHRRFAGSRPSRTARSGRSARSPTRAAGSRTAARTSSSRPSSLTGPRRLGLFGLARGGARSRPPPASPPATSRVCTARWTTSRSRSRPSRRSPPARKRSRSSTRTSRSRRRSS